MSLRDVHGGRALVLRLVLAELLAKRGEGPLAPRLGPLARPTERSALAGRFALSPRAMPEARDEREREPR